MAMRSKINETIGFTLNIVPSVWHDRPNRSIRLENVFKSFDWRRYCISLVLIGFSLTAAASRADMTPNIIFILADDLGWYELNCYGNTYNETPHLDSLATGGMRFTNAYASAPVCSPDRASLMTGQVPVRIGILKWLDRYDFDKNLPRAYTTVAEALKPRGYATGIVGKWHLSCYADDGDPDPIPPTQQGFDENLAGATRYIANGDYWWPYRGNGTIMMPDLPKAPKVLDPLYPNDEYLVDRCNYEALNFIERHQKEPFFLYLSHYAVHTVLDGKPHLVEHFESKPGSGIGPDSKPNNPHLASQLYTIDEGVGAIIAKLTEYHLLDNTIIVFMGDNGGAGNVTTNGPLRGAKGNLYEGGIRVPLIISWPGHIQSGSTCDEPVGSCDFYPTFAEITTTRLPSDQPMDGLSLVSLFTHPQATLNRDALCWYYPHNNQSAIRKRDWKLVENLNTGAVELFHLSEDLSEKTDLKHTNPVKTMELLNDLRAWRSSIPRLCDVNADGAVDIYEFMLLSNHWMQ